jgi:3-dehydroquinate synthetase
MDVVGHAAALYLGGVRYVRIPTTLVGIIDAGVGLKVGVNYGARKNFLGAYYPPVACLCDGGLLDTLPPEEIRCGLSEAIKIAAVKDATLFGLLEACHRDVLRRARSAGVETVLTRSVAAMLEELEGNPYEHDLRRLPDFGHEFGHVLEGLSRYELRHGEAVAIGMALSSAIAHLEGLLPRRDLSRLLDLLLDVGLPIHHPLCDAEVLERKVLEDIVPHKSGRLHLVVPLGIGRGGYIDDVGDLSPGVLRDACALLEGHATRTRRMSAPPVSRVVQRRLSGAPGGRTRARRLAAAAEERAPFRLRAERGERP